MEEIIINISHTVASIAKEEVWGNEFLAAVIGLFVAILAFFVPHVVERFSEMREQIKNGLANELIPHPGSYIIWIAIGIVVAGSALLTSCNTYRFVATAICVLISIYALVEAVRYVGINYDYIKDPSKIIRKIYLIEGRLRQFNNAGNFVEVLKNRVREGDYEFVEEGVECLLKSVTSEGQGSSDKDRRLILEQVTKIYNFIKKMDIMDLTANEVAASTRISGKLLSFLTEMTTLEIPIVGGGNENV